MKIKNKKILGLFLALIVITGGIVFARTDLLQGRFSFDIKSLVKPDLTITDIYVDDDFNLTIEQANIGNKAVTGNGYTYVYINKTLEWTYSWSTLSDTSFLASGGSSTLQPQTLEGLNSVRVCIDAKENIVEKDETNNCLEMTVGPEVNISYVSTSPNPFQVGDALEMTYNVQNQTSAPAPAGQVTIGFMINGVAFTEQTFEISEITSPGASNDFVLLVDSLPAAGSYFDYRGNEFTHEMELTKVEFSYGTTALSQVGGKHWMNVE